MKSPCQSPLPSRGRPINLIACVLCIALFTSACTNVRHFSSPHPASGSSGVQIGDKITCTLQDGTKREFVVTACDTTLLRGEGEIVAWSDLTEFEVSRFSPGKTAMVVSVILVAGLVAALAHSPGAFVGGPAIGL
jgi:hypothetical protein